jgi:hypothetical protein
MLVGGGQDHSTSLRYAAVEAPANANYREMCRQKIAMVIDGAHAFARARNLT